jgi:hypothetical protein
MNRGPWLAIGTSVLAVTAGVIVWAAHPESNRPATSADGATPSPSVSTTPSPLRSPSASRSPRPTESFVPGTAVTLQCPVEPTGRQSTTFRLEVVAWCAAPAVRHQAEVKIKLGVTNISKTVLDISLSRPSKWRLLIDRRDLGAWSPPARPRTNDAPIRVTCTGRQVWAIPPNADGAADRVSDTTATFATHWDATTLAPSHTYLRRERYKGDLVFYIPDGPGGTDTLDGLVGIAYVDRGRIVALLPYSEWGLRRDPATF